METIPRSRAGGRAFRAFAGCRTTALRQARGRGIAVFDIEAGGAWTHLHTVPAGDNPSYLLVDDERQALHCVHGDGASVSSFRVGPRGELSPSGIRSTQGTNPVHLALSAGRGWLVAANYATGSLVSLPVRDDGSLGDVACRLALPDRPGPHRSQQRGAHPHQVVADPSGRWLVVPDKGADAVHTLAIDERSGELRQVATMRTAPMSGPRHMVFSADGMRAWIVLELSSQVLAVRFDPSTGLIAPVQRTHSVPESFVGENTGAGVALSADERTLYVSNRGHGSVVRYAVEAGSGTLSAPAWMDVQGKVPRFISLLPGSDRVMVANEDADAIVSLDFRTSTVTPVAITGSPVCIVFSTQPQGTP